MNNQLKRRIQQIAILVGVVIIPLMPPHECDH